MPSTRGNLTPGEWPCDRYQLEDQHLHLGFQLACRVNNSDRFNPQALTLISTSPGFGFGIEMLSMFRTDGPPATLMTAAFIDMDG